MAIRRSVFAALLLKPIGVARDLTIILVFGLGAPTDGYYACMIVLAVAQGFVIGTLCNHWLPSYVRVPRDQRAAYFAATVKESLRLGVWIALVVVVTASVVLRRAASTQLAEAFLVNLLLLAPTIPLVFAVSWCGNRFLAEGFPMKAQVAFSAPSIALLGVVACVGVTPLPDDPGWLPLYHWVALALALLCLSPGRWLRSGFGEVHLWKPLSSASGGIGARALLASLVETAAFAAIQGALVLLPGSVSAGTGTLSGLVSRFYSSVLSLVVTPAGQGLLLQGASVESTTGGAVRKARKLIWGVVAIGLAGLIVSVPARWLLADQVPALVSDSLADFVAGYSMHFLASGLIVISARLLSSQGLGLLTSSYLAATYFVTLCSLPLIHPASRPVSYVILTGASLLVFGTALAVYALRGSRPPREKHDLT
jgi:hypothetical protein